VTLLAALALSTSAGCNLFGPIDSPSGDAQLISAARACFDQGDITCARELYAQVSANHADISASETAFAILDENGVDMGAFVAALASEGGTNAGSSLLTGLANRLVARAPNEASRLALYAAYEKVADIDNAPLRGLVRFVTSAALAAHMLAENAETAGDPAVVDQEDLATNPSSCQSAGSGGCAASGGCAPPSGAIMALSGDAFDITDTAPEGTNPTLEMFDAAVSQIAQAMSSDELGAGGDLGGESGAFADAVAQSPVAAENCFRFTLLEQGIGE
jgi:hypothetical protein